jgi:lipopolysaccharide export system protein LptA
VTLLADVQEANAKTGILTATGNVQIFYPSKGITATALQAQYFSRERRMVLTGNVVVNQVGGNTIRGEKVTYLVDEDRFIVVPKGHEQVRSVYVIPEEQSQESPGLPNLPPSPTPKPSTSLMDQLPQSP